MNIPPDNQIRDNILRKDREQRQQRLDQVRLAAMQLRNEVKALALEHNKAIVDVVARLSLIEHTLVRLQGEAAGKR